MNKYMKIIFKVCGITGLICVLCILCCLPFVNFTDSKVVVHADHYFQDFSFQSSNIAIPITFYKDTINTPTTNSSDIALNEFMGVYLFWTTSRLGVEIQMPGTIFSRSIDNLNNDGFWHNTSFTTSIYAPNNIKCFVSYKSSVDFDGDVVSVIVQTIDDYRTDTSLRSASITLVSRNNSTFQFTTCYVPKFSEGTERNYLDYRVYYLSSNFSDNEYYSLGQSYGEQIGEQRGLADGREQGYEEGKRDGIEIGKELGTDYSYVSFFTGLFDAPVAMIYNALDFELLGVNLYDFFCGLITVFLCLALIRFIRGK